jgi:ABC-type amino acid transport substrate-binding protein
MNKIAILSAAAAAAALVLAAPLTASAAQTPSVTAFTTCATGSVRVVSGADVYSGPNSFRVLTTVSVSDPPLVCLNGISLGRRYSACNESDGNGWIRLPLSTGQVGYSPQACFADA